MWRASANSSAELDRIQHPFGLRVKTIVIARDMGANVDVASGVSPSDRIIDNPADSLQDGDEVRIAANK